MFAHALEAAHNHSEQLFPLVAALAILIVISIMAIRSK